MRRENVESALNKCRVVSAVNKRRAVSALNKCRSADQLSPHLINTDLSPFLTNADMTMRLTKTNLLVSWFSSMECYSHIFEFFYVINKIIGIYATNFCKFNYGILVFRRALFANCSFNNFLPTILFHPGKKEQNLRSIHRKSNFQRVPLCRPPKNTVSSGILIQVA
jgi:hypothetical protein